MLSIGLFCSFMAVQAQTTINLNLHHVWDGQTFNYGQQYLDGDGNAVEISRVQYYLSGFDITHDGGQTTPVTGSYVLASSNITNYTLDPVTFTSLESIDFDLGVDAATNHLDPASYAANHPLALQTPSMHWGWSAGYRFLVIEGEVDSDGDGIVETMFQFHVTADDNYLTPVTALTTSGTVNGSNLDVDLYVNIADWVKGIDLTTAGSNHGAFPINGSVMANTNTNTVFSVDAPVGLDENSKAAHNVFFDYSTPYAPTVFYKFPESRELGLVITDMSGKVILSEKSLPNAGNYFINKELATGTYIAVFTADNQTVVSEKFVVSQ